MEIRLLKPDEIEVKVKSISDKGASLLLYKTARVDMQILDETYGAMNWQCDYKLVRDNLYCGIGIREGQDWVWKWDCGIESREDDEGNEKKGEASDAFKRAGFKVGIGRELYTSPFIFSYVETVPNGNKYQLKNRFQRFYVKDIGYTDKSISKLIINDDKHKTVFTMLDQKLPEEDNNGNPIDKEAAKNSYNSCVGALGIIPTAKEVTKFVNETKEGVAITDKWSVYQITAFRDKAAQRYKDLS